MKISICDTKEAYRGVDRNFPRCKKAPKDAVDKYLRYCELCDLLEDDSENLDEFIELYQYFSNFCDNIELIIISKHPICDEKYLYMGIDIGSDYDESVFSGNQHLKYDFLNEMKLIEDDMKADDFLADKQINEIGEKLEKYYIYRYV